MSIPSNGAPQDKNSVPQAFWNYRQFISVKVIQRDDGKIDKIPCDIHGRKIDAHDPANHITLDEALSRPWHVGFVFTRGDPFWFIDLDKAVEGENFTSFAIDILNRFPGAAWEVSTSGTGLHIFGSGTAPDHKSVITTPSGKIEFYDWGRFVLIPPGAVQGNASIDFTPQLASFVAGLGLTRDDAPVPMADGAPAPGSTGYQYSDEELIGVLSRMRGAAQSFGEGVTAWQLWTCDAAALATRWPESGRDDGMPFDWSSADAALFTHLAWLTGNDHARTAALFARSALYRPEKYEGSGRYRLDRLASYAAGQLKSHYNVQKAGIVGTSAAPTLPPLPVAIEPLPVPIPAGQFIANAPPPREWTVLNLVPHKQVTLVTGDGGTGKTTILLQLALASASMRSWFGNMVSPRRVLFVSGEDETADLHYRVNEIAKAMGTNGDNFWLMSFEDLVDGEIVGAMKRGDPLMRKPLFDHIGRIMDQLGITLLILDPTADLFGGDDNDPRHAKQFINMLRQTLGVARNATVILSAHPSKASMKTGEGYGGAVSWHNKVRSRLYFSVDPNDENARILEHAKSNRGQRLKKVRMIFKNGIFVEEGAADKTEGQIDEIFMTILRKRFKIGLPVSPHYSRSYAPTVFAADELSQGIIKEAFERSMMRLKECEKIDFVEEGPPSKRRTHIIPLDS